MAERLFIGIPITVEAAQGLAQELERHFPDGLPGKPVPAENWHVTVRFLGGVEAEVTARLRDELGAGGLGRPFTLVLDRLGAFPSPRRARVLWAGSERADTRIHDLARVVERRIRGLGFEPEARPFSPHVTLARLRDPEDLREPLASAVLPGIPLAVSEVVLFCSHLGGRSARYEVVESFPL